MAAAEHIELTVEGMTCVNCSRSVSRFLEKQGCTNVHVDFAAGEARFEAAPNTDISSLTNGLANIGFKAKLYEAAASETSGWSSIEKKFAFSLLFTVPLFLHMFAPASSIINQPLVQLALCLPVFAVGLWHFGGSALGSLRMGVANMDVLIALGSSSAFAYSLTGTLLYYGTPQMHSFLFYETAATIITLVLLGNVLAHRAVRKTTSAVRELAQLQASTAQRVVLTNGVEQLETVPASDLRPYDVVQVNEGDHIPADGSVLSGEAAVNEAMVTGESLPVQRSTGQPLVGGTLVASGNLRMRVERTGRNTVLNKIIELVKTAQSDQPDIQRLGDKVSGIFVPVVLGISALTFVVWWAMNGDAGQAMLNAVAVLVISCPCAMGLATPTAVMVGLGRAARNGILVKGASTLERLAAVNTMLFDKTGTLTTGSFQIDRLEAVADVPRATLVNVLYQLEQHSSHPIAKSIVADLAYSARSMFFSEVEERKGLGMVGKDADGNTWKAGAAGLGNTDGSTGEHAIYLWKNEELVGLVDISDALKPEAQQALNELRTLGIEPIMVSGDRSAVCEQVAQQVGIQQVYAQQSPDEKLTITQDFAAKGACAMVGDGINDAPALARANVGISLGNATRVAIDSAQIVLLRQQGLAALPTAVKVSRATLTTIKQNLFWAFAYNVVAIPIAALGLLNPMVAALTMAFSDVVVIGNSLRLRSRKL